MGNFIISLSTYLSINDETDIPPMNYATTVMDNKIGSGAPNESYHVSRCRSGIGVYII